MNKKIVIISVIILMLISGVSVAQIWGPIYNPVGPRIVYDNTLTAPTATIQVNNLNISNDKGYTIELIASNGSGTTCSYYMAINNNFKASDYYSNYTYNGTAANASTGFIGIASDTESNYTYATLMHRYPGLALLLFNSSRQSGGAGYIYTGYVLVPATSNITSFSIISSPVVSNCLSTTSRLRIWTK